MAQKRRDQRAKVLKEAFGKNPQRFVRGLPQPAPLPTAAWINKPKPIRLPDGSQPTISSNAIMEAASDVYKSQITNDTSSAKGQG